MESSEHFESGLASFCCFG